MTAEELFKLDASGGPDNPGAKFRIEGIERVGIRKLILLMQQGVSALMQV